MEFDHRSVEGKDGGPCGLCPRRTVYRKGENASSATNVRTTFRDSQRFPFFPKSIIGAGWLGHRAVSTFAFWEATVRGTVLCNNDDKRGEFHVRCPLPGECNVEQLIVDAFRGDGTFSILG